MADAIFNAAGDVNGGSGRIAGAWLGSGASAAPTVANILSAAGVTPLQAIERHLPAYTYSKPAPVDYQAIADQARAAQQSMLGFKDQSELQNYINEQVAQQMQAQKWLQIGGPWADNPVIRSYNKTGKLW